MGLFSRLLYANEPCQEVDTGLTCVIISLFIKTYKSLKVSFYHLPLFYPISAIGHFEFKRHLCGLLLYQLFHPSSILPSFIIIVSTK